MCGLVPEFLLLSWMAPVHLGANGPKFSLPTVADRSAAEEDIGALGWYPSREMEIEWPPQVL